MLWRDPKYAWGWKFRLVERKRFMPKKLIFTVFIYFLMCTRKMFIFNFVMCSGSYRVHELLASNNWKRCCCCRNAGETETQYRHKTIRQALSAIYRHREISADVCDLISSLSKLEITNTRIDSFYGSIKLPPSCRGICCSCWRTREREWDCLDFILRYAWRDITRNGMKKKRLEGKWKNLDGVA